MLGSLVLWRGISSSYLRRHSNIAPSRRRSGTQCSWAVLIGRDEQTAPSMFSGRSEGYEGGWLVTLSSLIAVNLTFVTSAPSKLVQRKTTEPELVN